MEIFYKLTLLTILAITAHVGTVSAQTGHEFSGFLGDYSQLRPDPEREGVYTHILTDWNRHTYPKIMINEILVFYAHDSKYKGINPKKLSAITETFREYLTEVLGERRTIVNKPGPSVLLLNLALTNVYARRPKRTALNILPPMLIKTGIQKAAGTDYWLTNAEFEAEAIDGKTYERVGAIVATRLGQEDKTSKEQKKTSWKDIDAELKRFTDRLRKRFDKVDAKRR